MIKKYIFFLVLVCIFSGASFSSSVQAGKDPVEIELLQPFPGHEDDKITLEKDGRKGAIVIMEQYVSQIFIYGAGLISVIAVIWIIIGGYEIMFSGASSGEITSGKDKIVKAILGIVLVFLSALLLHTINPQFFLLD